MAAISSPWTCLRCIRHQRRSLRRLYATAAAPARTAAVPVTYHETPHDDSVLRAIFDNPAFWKTFSGWQRAGSSEGSVGLFANRYLKIPAGFEEYAQATLQRCRRIVAKVLAVNTVQGYKDLVKDLDRLSDLLCRVIDLADFVRSTHPDAAFHSAATRAHTIMFEYMNQLNTTTGLYEQLTKAISMPEVVQAWTEEELRVAEILKKDFEQSAINLPPVVRDRFVTLSSKISELGAVFVDGMCPAKAYVNLPTKSLRGLDQDFLCRFEGSWGRTSVPATGPAANTVLRHAQDGSVRRQIYIASRTSAPEPLEVLEEFLATRNELAKLSGFSSFSEMTLENKMAQSAQSVNRFLDSLSAAKSPEMRQILYDIALTKQGKPEPWDIDHFTSRRSRRSNLVRLPNNTPAYFSLGTVIQGLSRLFSRLYGVRLVPRETGVGETWTPEVRRLDVVSETEGLIAVVYCDLFARVGKSPNPAHFTVRCSRQIPVDEIQEAIPSTSTSCDTGMHPHIFANDGMATRTDPSTGALYQLPTIALICDFSPPSHNATLPPLLTPSSLSTLFHEMGHAIHSILGRTRLQNVAGTRCATDFAELPSVLMERFATDPAVLRLYARHYETDEPLPESTARALQKVMMAGESAVDTDGQVMLARIDQALHGRLLGERERRPGWSDEVIRQVYRRHSPLEEPRETRAHGFFGHLVGYGSTYYAYLFDRAIAGRVWEQVFKGGRNGGAVDREAGEKYAREVLRWGGSRNPWTCVGGLLGGADGDVLSEGGEKAMDMVGRWGVDMA